MLEERLRERVRVRQVVERVAKGKGGWKYDSSFTVFIQDLEYVDLKFLIPSKSYLAYKARPRSIHNGEDNYWDFVTARDRYVDEIAQRAVLECFGSPCTPEWTAQLLVNLVHRIPYQKRKLTYVKYPVETLCEFGGNCADLSVLTVSLLENVGIDSCFVLSPDHVGVGIAVQATGAYVEIDGRRFYLTETSGTTLPTAPVQYCIGDGIVGVQQIAEIQRKRGPVVQCEIRYDVPAISGKTL